MRGVCDSGIVNLGDIRVVHQRQRLPLRFEARDDLACVHASFDDLERDFALHRLGLFGHEDDAEAPRADFLEEFVTANYCPGLFGEDAGLGRYNSLFGNIG